MNPTRQTLLEQMRFTEIEVSVRKALLDFTDDDARALVQCFDTIEGNIDALVSEFYEHQTSTPEIAALIGDADTLSRLQVAQRRYVLELFGGLYGLDYVNNRLRIGLVHKRIGVEPKLYLAAVQFLISLTIRTIKREHPDPEAGARAVTALNKLAYFDVTLVFEAYIQGMMSDLQAERAKTEAYARALEKTVAQRNTELRTDTLTGLVSRRFLDTELQRMRASAQRRGEPLSIVFIDVNAFKQINDQQGHARGDEVLQIVGDVLRESARGEDVCIRYGGDEFCVLLANSSERHASTHFCTRVENLLAARLPGVSVSMGVVQTGPLHFDDTAALLRRADERMYKAKNDNAPLAMQASGS